MASYTPNYNLKKPADADTYDIADANGNMDLIDTALHSQNEAIAKLNVTYIESQTSFITLFNGMAQDSVQNFYASNTNLFTDYPSTISHVTYPFIRIEKKVAVGIITIQGYHERVVIGYIYGTTLTWDEIALNSKVGHIENLGDYKFYTGSVSATYNSDFETLVKNFIAVMPSTGNYSFKIMASQGSIYLYEGYKYDVTFVGTFTDLYGSAIKRFIYNSSTNAFSSFIISQT